MSFLTDLFGSNNQYHADVPILGGQEFRPDIRAAQAGLNNTIGQQQQLAQALQAQSMGQGPNPAQAALNQATGANTANQAALMAGQRGTNANAGLLARNAAMQGAANQQQAAGQGATMQAQQQIAAQQALAQQQGQIAGEYGNQFGQLQQAQANQNNAINTATLGTNQINAGVAAGNQTSHNQVMGNVLGGAGAAIGKVAGLAHGGTVPTYSGQDNAKLDLVPQSDRFDMPDHIRGMAELYHGGYAFGGEMKEGGSVPGKAPVKGDSPKNDIVPAALSPGEIVIPRHIVQGENAAEKAKQFVAEELKKHGHGSDEKADFHDALKKAIKGRKK